MDNKITMQWKVSKEMEEEYFKEAERTWNFHRSHTQAVMIVGEAKKMIDELKDLFKMIRGAEYRRGKQDAEKESLLPKIIIKAEDFEEEGRS